MILAETTVVIDYIRGRDAKVRSVFTANLAAICGITRAEILCGTRDPSHRQKLVAGLAAFQLISIPESLWDTVGDHLAALRNKGVTVPFQDAVIATVAMANGLEVWSRDPHFAAIQRILPALRLFQEPP